MKKTNKTFKRFAAITSASLLAACAVAPIFTSMTSYAATNDFTLSAPSDLPTNSAITNVRAYKIFAGTYDESKNTFNVTAFADGVTSETLGLDKNLTATAAAEAITEDNKETVAKTAAAALGSGTGIAGTYDSSTSKVSFGVNGLTTGYYLVLCDVTNTSDENVNTYKAVSLGMLTVTGTDNAQIGTGTAKVGLPEVMKKVKENSSIDAPVITINGVSFEEDQSNEYNDIADYNIGDPVPFKLYGSLPVDLAKYDTYYYKFTDTLGTQFNNPTKMTITVDETVYIAKYDNDSGWGIYDSDMSTEKMESSGIIVKNAETGNGFTVEFTDIKSMVTDTTTNTVNEDAIITVAYDAVLNSSANIGLPGQENSVKLTYSNNPNKSGSGISDDDENTGTTPEDEVIVFTYEIDVTKKFQDAADNDITVTDDIKQQVKFKLKDSDGNYIKFSKKMDGAAIDYFYVDSTNGADDATELTINDLTSNKIEIRGLDKGTYTLVETGWPTGYNKADDEEITIDAKTANNIEWTNGSAHSALTGWGETTYNAETQNATDSILPVEVINKKGTTLPGTGGIGTTIFYLGGGAMAAIGGIYLISKRRMRKSEE